MIKRYKRKQGKITSNKQMREQIMINTNNNEAIVAGTTKGTKR